MLCHIFHCCTGAKSAVYKWSHGNLLNMFSTISSFEHCYLRKILTLLFEAYKVYHVYQIVCSWHDKRIIKWVMNRPLDLFWVSSLFVLV